MGNESSSGCEDTADGLLINTVIIKQILMLSYEDFLEKVKEINQISKNFNDSSGTHLIFVIKKGSDSTILWKNTVRIACIRVEQETRKIVSHRFLKLRQFLRLYTLLSNYVSATVTSNEPSCSSNTEVENTDQTNINAAESVKYTTTPKTRKDISASFIFQNLDSLGEEGVEECIICLERRPEVSLACAHSYCLPCIEQWNVTHKTCPICREEVTTDDSWVISEAPDLQEVEAEVRKALDTVVK